LGSGAGASTDFHFTNSGSPGVVSFSGGITIGTNGSSGNDIAFTTLFGNNVSGAFTNGAVSIGSLNGGNNRLIADDGGTHSFSSLSILTVGGTETPGNNRFVVENGTALNFSSNLSIQGNASVTATVGGETYDNQFLVRDGAAINHNAGTSTKTISIGSGSEFRLTGGSSFGYTGNTTVQTNVTVEAKGLLLLDNSSFTRTGGLAGSWTISGEMHALNQSAVEGAGGLTINSSGRIVVDESTMSSYGGVLVSGGAVFSVNGAGSQFINTSQNRKTYDPAKFVLAGTLAVVNGAIFDSQSQLFVTSDAATISVNSGSSVIFNTQTVDKATIGLNMNVDSQGITSSKLTIQGGGEVYAQGQWDLSKGTAYGYSAGEVLVETNDGSVLRVDSMSFHRRGNARNYIPVLGTVILQSGFSAFDEPTTVRIGNGTTLQLAGGTYGLGYGTNVPGGILQVEAGGALTGYGVLETYAIINDGGVLEVGAQGDFSGPATLEFRQTPNALKLNSGSTISFDLYGEGISDQIVLSTTAFTFPAGLNVQVRLAEGYEIAWEAGQEYNLVSAPNYGLPQSYTFTQLPDLGPGLDWDTSQFATTGSIFVVAATSTPLESWRQTWFGTTENVGEAGNIATPAGDGISNLMKFATSDGTVDPNTPGIMPGEIDVDGNNIIFTYTRNKAAIGVTFAVQWSDTLQAESWSATGVTETEVVDQGDTELVTVTIPKGTGTKRFVRLEVTSQD